MTGSHGLSTSSRGDVISLPASLGAFRHCDGKKDLGSSSGELCDDAEALERDEEDAAVCVEMLSESAEYLIPVNCQWS